jgi:hypothetical protein
VTIQGDHPGLSRCTDRLLQGLLQRAQLHTRGLGKQPLVFKRHQRQPSALGTGRCAASISFWRSSERSTSGILLPMTTRWS